MRATHVQVRLDITGSEGRPLRVQAIQREDSGSSVRLDENRRGEASNEGREGGLELRGLNDFGNWLCIRAAVY